MSRAAEASPLHVYIVLSLLTGARTEELRALRWSDGNLAGKPDAPPRRRRRSRCCARSGPAA
jgi:integrase